MAYQYRVKDPLGNVLEGNLEAGSVEEATQQLRRDGFSVLEVQEGDGAVAPLFPRRIRKNDVIYKTSQLAIMVDTGITLSAALDGICQQEQNPTLKRVLDDLKKSVEAGQDFSTALARHPKLFDRTYVSLVRSSEATGSLGTMLDRIAGYLRKELETRGKIRAAMAYPAVMLVMAIGVTIFLLSYVLPKFTPLFTRQGAKLPLPTKIMMTVSDYLTGYWYVWVALTVALVVGFVFGRKTPRGRIVWDWFKINAPLIGPLFRKVTISRSIRTLGTMIASGVPMLDALRLCSEVAGNYFYEQLWIHVQDRVSSGDQICDALAGNPLFPPMLVQMISSGEQTGKLDSVLERVSTYFDHEVETSVKTVTSMIEPIMITLMGVVVGGIGMALMLPIFQLSKTH